MTHIQYVNCEKWKNIIRIILWFTITVFLIHVLIYSMFHLDTIVRTNVCTLDLSMNEHCVDKPDYIGVSLLLTAITMFNSFNFFFIWKKLNSKYKWLEIRCGIKPTNISSKEDTKKC